MQSSPLHFNIFIIIKKFKIYSINSMISLENALSTLLNTVSVTNSICRTSKVFGMPSSKKYGSKIWKIISTTKKLLRELIWPIRSNYKNLVSWKESNKHLKRWKINFLSIFKKYSSLYIRKCSNQIKDS